MLRKRFITLTSAFLFLVSFGAKADLISIGANATIMANPYPALGGLNLTASFLDFARVEAGIAGAQIVTSLIGLIYYTYGAGVRFRIPWLPITPTAGLAISRQHVDETQNTIRKGKGRKVVQTFLTPSLGAELRPTGSFYLGAGLMIAFEYLNNSWKLQEHNLANSGASGTKVPILPFGYVGLEF